MALEEIGVTAIVAGFQQYMQNSQSVNAATMSMGASAKAAAASTGPLAAGQGQVTAAGAAMTVVMVAAGVEAQKLASDLIRAGEGAIVAAAGFEKSTTNLQNQAGISKQAAAAISDAILAMGKNSLFSAGEMIAALAPVAGRLQTLTGRSLDATMAQDVLRASSALAAASESSLSDATSALVSVMVAYKMPLSDASAASDQLFNTSRITGVGIGELATAVDRMHEKLGIAAPSLAETGALVAELASLGLSGSRGLLAATTAIDTLTAGSAKVNQTLYDLGTGVFDAQGKFIGLGNVIAELGPIYQHLTEAQQAETSKALFGSQVFTDVINAQASTYQTFVARVDEGGTSSAAAANKTKDLSGQLDILKNRVNAASIEFAQSLIPALDDAITKVNNLTDALGTLASAGGTGLGKVNDILSFLHLPDAGTLAKDYAKSFLSSLPTMGPLFGAAFNLPSGPKLTPAQQMLKDPRWTNLALDMKAYADVTAISDAAASKLNTTLGVQPALFADIKSAVADALKAFKDIDPVSEALKAQIALQNEYKLGLEAAGQSTKEVDEKLAGLNNALQQQTQATDAAKAVVSLYGYELNAAGLSATAAGAEAGKLAEYLDTLPAAKKTEILMKLPLDDMNAMLRFLTIFDTTHDLDIAIRLQNADELSKIAQLMEQSGTSFVWDPNLVAGVQGALNLAPVPNPNTGLGTGGSPSTPGIDTAAGKTSAALTKTEDDLKALADAFAAFGGTLADFKVALKLGADEASIDQRVAQAQTNLAAATMENANASYKLKEIYIALAEEAIRSGRTIEQVTAEMFAKIAQNALSTIQSAINQAFSEQTVQDLQLQLKVDQLTLERDRLMQTGGGTTAAASIAAAHLAQQRLTSLEDEAARAKKAGATDAELAQLDAEIRKVRAQAQEPGTGTSQLDAINKQIKAIQDEITVRKDELAVLKDKVELDDKTRASDETRLTTITLLDTALKIQSEQTRNLNLIAFAQATAMQNATDQTNNFAAAAAAAAVRMRGGSEQDANNAYFNALPPDARDRLAVLLQHLHDIGQLHSGGVVTAGGLFQLKKGEAVFDMTNPATKQVFAQLPAGIVAPTYTVPFAPNLTVLEQGLSVTDARRVLHQMIDEWFTGARGTVGRSGATLSSAIT